MRRSRFFLVILIAILGAVSAGLFKYVFKHEPASAIQYKYQYDLAILNKSFKRDLERSVILYKSFEKYFLDAKNTPFFIVIPLADLEVFENRFQVLKTNNEINNLPQFLAEQEVLNRCGEPDIASNGSWTQQVVKLCFGVLDIAKNYIMIDSDNYFTKTFDPTVLFEDGYLKTAAWKQSKELMESYKTYPAPWFTDKVSIPGANSTVFNYLTLVKDFFGNNNPDFYGFVMSPCLFNSDALHRMRALMEKKGGYKFSMLIRIVPFEMQWYGEYILQHEKFIPYGGMFKLINSPDECHPEDGGEHVYGVWFQSLIYDYKTHSPDAVENTQLIYKRPPHCDK